MRRAGLAAVTALALGACKENGGGPAPVGAPEATAAATASAVASAAVAPAGSTVPASATTEVPADAGPKVQAAFTPPRVHFLDPPDPTPTKVPARNEWEARSPMPATATPCETRQVREWVRVKCTIPNGSVTLTAGPADEVFYWGDPTEAEVVFALRRGKRRVIAIVPGLEHMGGYGYGHGGGPPPRPAPPIVVSTAWLESEPGPRLAVR